MGLTSLEAWREAVCGIVPEDAIPDHPDFGTLYPWRALAVHATSGRFQRRVDAARRLIDDTLVRLPPEQWRLALSGGKDSLALAALLSGRGVRAFVVGDDCPFPGEEEHTEGVASRLGLPLDRVRPSVSIAAMLPAAGLVGDLHSRRSEIARVAFYEPIAEYQRTEDFSGTFWGLRAEESRGRRMRRRTSGLLYRCAAGWRCAPVGDWSALDVHALLASRGIPIAPPYLCVDPGMDPLSIRTDWWFAGGFAASIGGHYVWLRRWWPVLWDRAVEIDPRVAEIS